jgi:transposase
VQAAWCIVRRRRRVETAALRAWTDGIASRRGRSIAVVALARRLAGMLFAIWRDGSVYDGTKVRGPLPARRAA